jgi:glyoxylase-like metal-dependent hydrolase (beta-lactamase superfamily II)
MQSIARNVYIENNYLGVVLGVISLPRGLVQIDAPPSPEDGRSWRASLLSLGGGPERIMVNLDAHPDRTLGARGMDCTIVAHERVAQVYRSRSNTFKAQGDETGADWETIGGLGNVRWAPPEITFSQQMSINWGGDSPVLLESHPGPSSGAAWVVLPASKVVFVGDAVLKSQPPFLMSADLPAWLETLKLLLSPAYRGWDIVSGRSGLVIPEIVRAQREMLEQILKRLEKLAAKKAKPDATESIISHGMGNYRVPAARQRQFTQRLRYGLYYYYVRHYHASNTHAGEE